MTLYLDRKIDLLLEVLRRAPDTYEVPLIVRDIRDAYDAARTCPSGDNEVYRVRSNKLLTCASLVRQWAVGRDYEYLGALQGVLIDVMRGKVRKEEE